MDDDGSPQLWLGNIPEHLTVDDLVYELACYSIRPLKVKLCQRGESQDMLSMCGSKHKS